MKKIISMILTLTMVATSMCTLTIQAETIVDTASNSIYYDFEGYEGNQDKTIASLTSYTSQFGLPQKFGLSAGKITNAATERGTSVDLIYPSGTSLSYPYLSALPYSPISTSAHLAFSVKLGGNIVGNHIKYNNTYIGYIMPSGISFMGTSISTISVSFDVWYDVDIKLNNVTGYYVFTITDGVNSATGEGVSDIFKSQFNELRFGFHTSGVMANDAHLYLDDLTIEKIPSFNKSCKSENDFDSFEGSVDGTSVPDGFTSEGTSVNVNGFYADNGKIKIVSGNETPLILKKNIPIPSNMSVAAYGTIRAMIDINLSDKNADRIFTVGSKEVLKFTSEGNIIAGAGSVSFETGSDYTVSISINTKTNVVTASVYEGGVQLISDTIDANASDITDVSLKTVQTVASSEAFIDNFNIYNDNGLSVISVTPESGSKNIKPCDVSVSFCNPIASIGYVTLNGEAVSWNLATNSVVNVYTASEMEYDKQHTLILGDVKDIFGETQSYSFKFSTIAAKIIGDVSITSDSAVTAKVSGVSNDGENYSYSIILAQFNSLNNMLVNIDKTDFTLDTVSREYTASLPVASDAYYEAYLWNSIGSMSAVSKKAVLGDEPFSSVAPGQHGFKENMDTGVMTGTGLGIDSQASSTLIILKPGKSMADISSALKLTDVIDFIKQFDNKADDVFAYTPSGGNGSYSYALDGAYTSDAFTYIDPSYVEQVYDEINSDGASFIDCIEKYNDILGCDKTELSSLSDGEKAEIEAIMLDIREDRDNGFDTIASFQDAYYSALAFVLIKNSTEPNDVKAALEKYGTQFGIKGFMAYKTYSESNDTAKAEVYAAIAKESLSDKDTLEKIDVIFSNNTVLAGVRNSQKQIQIGNILNDNNDTILHFDFSNYNKITNKSALHTKLIGAQVQSIEDFKQAFNTAVSKRLEEEANEKDVSSGVVASGNFVSYDFEGYVGNNDTLSITSLTNWSTGWSYYGLADGLAGPTSVKTDRGTSLNLVNRAGASEYSSAVLRPLAKSYIYTSAEIKISMQFKDLNRPRTLLIYDGAGKQVNSCLIRDTSFNLLGNTLTMKPEVDKWYDFTFRINKVSGYYEASVSCGTNTETVSGVNTAIVDLAAIGYLGIGYIGDRTSGTETNTWYDDLTIRETDPLYVSYISQSDFGGFNEGAGGTSVPDGFSAAGIVNAKNGFYSENDNLVMKTTQPGDLSLIKEYRFANGYNASVFGTIRTDIELVLSDKAADRIINIGNYEVARFGSDGQFIVGEATTSYDIDKAYKLSIKASPKKLTDDKGETYYNLVTVLVYDENGQIFNATKKIPDENIVSISLLVSAGDTLSKTTVNSFDVYNDNGFYISASTPSAYEKSVIPCDAQIAFSNQIQSVRSVTLNEKPVTFEIVGGNKLKLKTESSLEYNTKNVINIYGAKDMFGETKDFKLTFYTTFASYLTDISIKDGSNVTASVSGFSYDGNKYVYTLVIAKFDSATNKLLDVKKSNISLGASTKEFSVNIPKTDGAYYEAYVWDSIKGMGAIKDKATLGTNALADVKPGKDGYIQNMDTNAIVATNTGVSGNGRNTLLIFKPGKNMSHLASAASICDVIDYIGQFDNSITDVYAYTPANGGGKYGVAINGVYKSEAFNYIDPSYIEETFLAINSDGASFVDCINNYNDVLQVDTAELSGFDTDEKARLEELILEEREKLDNGFETAVSFKNTYNYAVSRVVIENASSADDVKIALEKYGDELGLKDFVAYENYEKLSQTAKNAIYGDIAACGDLSTVDKIEDAFAKASILRTVQYADNYVEVNNVIVDNNDYLKFDLSTYNSLRKQSNVNKALVGNYYENLSKLQSAFITAVLTQKNSESGNGSAGGSVGSSPGTTAGNMVTLGPVQGNTPVSVFKDLANHSWAKDAIEALALKGIVSGRGNGLFDPDANITREEFAKIIINAFIGVDENLTCTFGDVQKGEWYYPYIATAQKLGIINGTSATTFGTGEKIARQDMAAILFRAAKQCGIVINSGDLTFEDSEYVDDYAKEAVGALSSSGIINGKGNNLFEPKSFATRAECAKMIYGLMERGDN